MSRSRVGLGSVAYLWIDYSFETLGCVIDAHGCFESGDNETHFTNDTDADILFLAAHGDALPTTLERTQRFVTLEDDPDDEQSYRIMERVKPGQRTWDYVLTKFQQGHDKGDRNRLPDYTYDAIISWPKGYDVATVRNRWSYDGVYLSWLVNKVFRKRKYRAIYCKFCRSEMSERMQKDHEKRLKR